MIRRRAKPLLERYPTAFDRKRVSASTPQQAEAWRAKKLAEIDAAPKVGSRFSRGTTVAVNRRFETMNRTRAALSRENLRVLVGRTGGMR